MNDKKISITLTPAAVAHVEKVMQDYVDPIGFRLSMRKYGCNGYGYVPEVIETLSDDDIELSLGLSVRIFIDAKYAKWLDGTRVDYVEKSLGHRQLIFYNPNAEGECGCGESINIKVTDED